MRDKMTHLTCITVLFFVFCAVLASIDSVGVQGSETTSPVAVDVGIIWRNPPSEEDMVIISCINMSLTKFYEKNGNYSTKLSLKMKLSKGEVVTAAAAALDLIKYEQVQAIISPPTSMETNFVKALGERAKIPVITFTATDPSLTSVRSSYFFRASQNDSTQTRPISALMEAFGWREAVPIYVDNEFGQGILPYLAAALEDVRARIPFHCPIPLEATDDHIDAALSNLKTMSTRVFIVHMESPLGKRIFSQAKSLDMMSEGYAWILTDSMSNFIDSFNSSDFSSMQGVLGVRPFVERDKKLLDLERRWKAEYRRKNPANDVKTLDIFSLYGYDTVTALAIAVERLGRQHFSLKPSKLSGYSKDLTQIPVSVNGSDLVRELSTVSFRGLSGNFRFDGGQLPLATYQIVNIYGNGYKEIGLWTPNKGLGKNCRASLSPVNWPGNSVNVPKGWEIPLSGKKLKIVVPVKEGYSEFVTIMQDGTTTRPSGFSIDVFEEVVRALPYALRYEYIPFTDSNGSMKGDYDAMLRQVHLGEFDAAVGDITITAKRSEHVDFTMPYTESGVSIIVPSTYGTTNNPWIFLKPLTWKLWVTSLCCFIGFAIVIWYLERKVNPQFNGPQSQRVSNSLWFSFSTMCFNHNDNIVRTMTKVVVIVWCFFVLILVQSFTASLTSLLTVRRLNTVTLDVAELIRKDKQVGYYNGSFVRNVLLGLNFTESNLHPYKNFIHLHELFQSNSIFAAVDETPYLRPFIAKHCDQYTEKYAFETGGFGFVFPSGSPLAPDVSRAVLKVVTTVYNTSMDGTMSRIQDKWLSPNGNCSAENSNLKSSRLDLNSFKGLFMILGGTSVLAVVMATGIDYWNGISSHRRQRALKLIRRKRITPQETIAHLDADPRMLDDCCRTF